MWAKNTNRNTRLYCERARARARTHTSRPTMSSKVVTNGRKCCDIFQLENVWWDVPKQASWIKIQDGGYNKKRLPREWSEARYEMQAIATTSDSPPACQLHLSAARHIHSRRNSFQRWNDVRGITAVNGVRKANGTCFYAILSSWVLGDKI